MRWVALSAVVAALVSISSFGFATVVQVLPGLFDPDGTGIVTAHWITRQGLADDVGKANHALFLQKDGPTSVNASAFAVIGGVEGLTLTELGFDYRNDGHCGAGAPRFNVTLPDGRYFFFGCVYGNPQVTESAPGWTRIRWKDGEGTVFPAGNYEWPGFGVFGVVVQSIAIVFDEGTDQGSGFAFLDNININGSLIGKPTVRTP